MNKIENKISSSNSGKFNYFIHHSESSQIFACAIEEYIGQNIFSPKKVHFQENHRVLFKEMKYVPP